MDDHTKHRGFEAGQMAIVVGGSEGKGWLGRRLARELAAAGEYDRLPRAALQRNEPMPEPEFYGTRAQRRRANRVQTGVKAKVRP